MQAGPGDGEDERTGVTGSGPHMVPSRDVRDLAVEAERLAHLKKQMVYVLSASIVIAPFVGWVLRGSLGAQGAIAWCGSLILLSAVRGLWVSRQSPPATWSRQRRQVTGYVFGSGMAGLLCGLLGALTIRADQGLDSLYALMFISGMVAGAVGSLATLPLVYYEFSLPAIGPVILLYGLQDDAARNIYAYAAAVFLAVNLGYAFNLGRSVRHTIDLRFDKAELIQRLEVARRRAERDSEVMSRFLQSASHDLRQPLYAVTLLLADLSEVMPKSGSAKLAQAQSSVMSLALLLDRLLEASRAGAGDMKPTLSPVALLPLLQTLFFEHAGDAEERGLTLTMRDSSFTVVTDEVMLTQILRNYLGNALRHGRTKVLTGVRRRGAMARIEVWDDGPGIPSGEEVAIFEPFYQIGNAARDPRLGYGLGLAIVSAMARLLGAPHGVRSKPGKGAMFYIDIPLSTEPVPGGEVQSGTAADDMLRDADSGVKVLIIEDNEEVRTLTADLISRWGYAVEAVASGEEAFDLVQAGYLPDLLVTDFLLPGACDGITVALRLRAILARPLPVAIVTGNAGALEQARQAGGPGSDLAVTVLKKPLLPGRLKSWLSVSHQMARSKS